MFTISKSSIEGYGNDSSSRSMATLTSSPVTVIVSGWPRPGESCRFVMRPSMMTDSHPAPVTMSTTRFQGAR